MPFTQHGVDSQALQVFSSLNCEELIQRRKQWKPSHESVTVSWESARQKSCGRHRAAEENLRTEGFMAHMSEHLLVYYIFGFLSLVICSPQRSHKRQRIAKSF